MSTFAKEKAPWLMLGVLAGGIAAFLITYFALQPADFDPSSIKEKIFGRVPRTTAEPNLGTYRKDGAYASLSLHKKAKVYGVLHDTTSFIKYFTVDFRDFKNTHDAKTGYAWQIGIYPMVCEADFEGNDKPRIGIYFIPTMVKANVANPKPSDILDYMTAIKGPDSVCYKKRGPISLTDPNDDFIFDEGHLWP